MITGLVFSSEEALSTYSGSLLWGTPSFVATNYLLTGIFATVFLVNTIICTFTTACISLSVPFVLLFLALISTKILPGRFVPYYEKKHSSPQGKCSLGRGKAEKPDLIITINKDDWFAISEGKLDGTKAFMEGRMKVEGDMSHLFRMEKAFPRQKVDRCA